MDKQETVTRSTNEKDKPQNANVEAVPKNMAVISLLAHCFLFVATSILVFTIGGYNYFIPDEMRLLLRGLIAASFLIVTVGMYRHDKLHKYRRVSLAFFAVATGIFLASIFGGWWLLIPGLIKDSVEGWALAKVAEAVPIIAAILLLVKLDGGEAHALLLVGGNKKRSLVLGLLVAPLELIQFATMTGFTLNVGAEAIGAWLPWMMVFAVSNSLMEELMFRGLFLQRYAELLRPKTSLLLTSVIFAIFHAVLLPFMGLALVMAFIVFTFILGWIWGSIMQKTGSIWGAVLAHAVGDVLFVLAAFGV
nr:type II CAAX endopeptidase family protein [Candidatus Sigynarchaeota archaeon]